MSILDSVVERYSRDNTEVISLDDYFDLLKSDPMTYANAAHRMLKAIGEPEVIETAKDPKLGRIFMNQTIKTYKSFEEFYGMESAIESIVSFFVHASQGLEEKKQILYLTGLS